MQGLDKVLHSAVGLGFYISTIITLTWENLVFLLVFALLKETFDFILYRKFDMKDIVATLNPFIVMDYYAKQSNLKEKILNLLKKKK